LQQVRQTHPDKQNGITNEAFYKVQEAYQHLLKEGGLGKQCNPAHSLPLLLQNDGEPAEGTKTTATVPLYDKVAPDRISLNSKLQPPTNPTISTTSSENVEIAQPSDRFRMQLLAVLSEYGAKGMDVSNVKKKWQQVWGIPFPDTGGEKMARWLAQQAGDVISIRKSRGNKIIVHPRARLDRTDQLSI